MEFERGAGCGVGPLVGQRLGFVPGPGEHAGGLGCGARARGALGYQAGVPHEHGHDLLDVRVPHPAPPGRLGKSHGGDPAGDVAGRRAPGRSRRGEARDQARAVRGSRADGILELEVVVGGPEALDAPSRGAGSHGVDEGAGCGMLMEGPGRHVPGVLRVEVRAVEAAAVHLVVAQAVVLVCSGKRSQGDGDDGVAVRSAVLELAKQGPLAVILDVARHVAQGLA